MINPFSLDTMRLPLQHIIDRSEQRKFLKTHVIDRRENVLVVGPFGVGKTCILRKFREELLGDLFNHTLIIKMEMRRISADPAAFLNDIVLQLMSAFWVDVLHKPGSELLRAVTQPRNLRDSRLPDMAEMVLGLYRLARTKNAISNTETQNVEGFDKIVKMTRQYRSNRSIERGSLTPGEFINISNEFLDALKGEGIERTLSTVFINL